MTEIEQGRAWENQIMSTAPQDCLRTYRLDTSATSGWTEYGETFADITSTETMTEDSGQIKLSILKTCDVSPLPYGTFLRVFLYGDIVDGVPVWEYEENGEPKNFRNYFVVNANSRWFEQVDYYDEATGETVHLQRYRHDYTCEEPLAYLKDFPIRSVKTFAAGAYTFEECINIAFKLAFRPRAIGLYNYQVDIMNFPGLKESNSKLEYPNSTLYDVITDIGRIIDGVPSLEIRNYGKQYHFELRFLNRYGLEGTVRDISYFNMKMNDAITIDRETSAGECVSNVQNLLTGGIPTKFVEPRSTNLSGNNALLQLSYPIDEVEQITIRWKPDVRVLTQRNGMVYMRITYSYNANDDLILTLNSGNIQVVSNLNRPGEYTNIYLADYDRYQYLPNSGNGQTKNNTIYYSRGSNEINLTPLMDKYVFIYKNTWTNGTYYYNDTAYFQFRGNSEDIETPTDYIIYQSSANVTRTFKFPFFISIKYKAILNGVVKGVNNKESDYTAFFNQAAQVVDIESFGNAVMNYTKSMYGESRVVAHTYENIARRAMYESVPRVGSSVIDNERGKRYVVTETSFTRRQNGGLLLATLAESQAGKSRVIMADNRQRNYAIPNNGVVDSMSHTHIICKMGLTEFELKKEHYVNIAWNYLFNALTANVTNGFNGVPNKLTLAMYHIYDLNKKLPNDYYGWDVSDTVISDRTIDDAVVYFSRMRQSVIMSTRMLNNSVYKISGGEPVLYTDSGGKIGYAILTYKNGDLDSVSFSQWLLKDSYEILNHTTQISWVGYGNLEVGESFIDMSLFGDMEGINDDLKIVLLNKPIDINAGITSDDTVAEYDAGANQQLNNASKESFYIGNFGIELSSSSNERLDIPDHVGWALVRGDKILLLDNFDKIVISQFNLGNGRQVNGFILYYQIELRN